MQQILLHGESIFFIKIVKNQLKKLLLCIVTPTQTAVVHIATIVMKE